MDPLDQVINRFNLKLDPYSPYTNDLVKKPYQKSRVILKKPGLRLRNSDCGIPGSNISSLFGSNLAQPLMVIPL